MNPTAKARAWCFTVNNGNDEEWTKLQALECTYIVVGREVGASGTKHFQGYVVYPNAKSFASVKRDVGGRAHVERAKGSAKDNQVYCTKEGDSFERGTLPSQGKRNDIGNVREAIRAGGSMLEVLAICESYQAARFGELYLKYHEPKRKWKPEVLWFYGATGTGKSKRVAELYPDAFWISDGKWWCGYCGHLVVIWDDFRADQVKFTRLLRIIDRYPMTIETKGGQRQLLFVTIVFTSPKHPKDCYDKGEEEVQQLLRRIDKVTHFTKLA